MSKVSTYLNFLQDTEKAFNFYKEIFGTELMEPGFMRYGDIPVQEGMQPCPEDEKNLIMHVELPILDGHLLMGTDVPRSMQSQITQGNNVYIMLQPDTRKETRKLFDALSKGGTIEQELQDMFWGDYYGSCTDKFGVHWMFDCTEKAS
ncbi:VOC family protein [Prolixibacter sp. NT017]|uniref:VOC family protein n=1 Tax=Prolixibacter sp. NT017 TaxID=2652390 RepID=UPI001280C1BF|nr:VOC family protein [Prolixibacter sp. NT017]GET25081.1 VOC family protein [Prolixibacter sp. NT017]